MAVPIRYVLLAVALDGTHDGLGTSSRVKASISLSPVMAIRPLKLRVVYVMNASLSRFLWVSRYTFWMSRMVGLEVPCRSRPASISTGER